MDPKPGELVNGRFRLERPLAQGGMGQVWVARHLELDLPVAIKFIASGGSSIARTRFEREARAAAQLRSPHVVQIMDYGVDRDTPYLVMELCEGEDLKARLSRVGRLSLAELSALLTQLAKGLALAHEAGIVHRDLKPGNVFIARVGDEEIVKVLDFGVAKDTRDTPSGDSTTTGLLVGSPQYMSPEQARGGSVDHRSDLWSLGVLSFMALTGHQPFSGSNVGDVIVRICTEPVPSARSFVSELPPAIDGFFARALSRSPDGRFGSAREMADALSAIARDAPSSVPALSRPVSLARDDVTVSLAGVTKPPARRNEAWRWGVVASVFVALALSWIWRERARSVETHEPEPAATTELAAPSASATGEPASPTTEPPAPSARRPSTSKSAPAEQRSRPLRPKPSKPATTIDPKFGLPMTESE